MAMNCAVIGHVEWGDFLAVPHLPASGAILHATTSWAEAAGGGAVAAMQLARLGAAVDFFVALGDDELAGRSREDLAAQGVRVLATTRKGSQTRAVVLLEPEGERTIIVFGERWRPMATDDLPWTKLATVDSAYFCKGDPAALVAARQARVLVATARELANLRTTGVLLDALVHSQHDAGEAYHDGDLPVPPRLVVTTEGAAGGRWRTADGQVGRYEPAPLPGARQDAYGCGDSFAAGLTWALGQGLGPAEATAVAARCGAEALCRRGAGTSRRWNPGKAAVQHN